MEVKIAEILLIEDDPIHALLTQEAFKKTHVKNNITIVKTAKEAIKHFHKIEQKSLTPKPDLILLDIVLPDKNGFELLKEIKNNPTLKDIPVIVLTGNAESQADIVHSYEAAANGFINKPVDIDDFINTIHSLERFLIDFNPDTFAIFYTKKKRA